ncbi:adenylate cyclase, partial [Rhizobium ruizarguesonis]
RQPASLGSIATALRAISKARLRVGCVCPAECTSPIQWFLAYLLAYERSFAEADAGFAKAIELDPNEADTFAALSDITVLAGRVGEG